MNFCNDWETRVLDQQQAVRKNPLYPMGRFVLDKTIRWPDLILQEQKALADKVYPELDAMGYNLILFFLGYFPAETICLTHEPMIRALHAQYTQGAIDRDTLFDQLFDVMIHLRNDAMAGHTAPDYSPELYEEYNRFPQAVRAKASRRLKLLCGNKHVLLVSLYAELLLMRAYMSDREPLPNSLTQTDYEALTIVRYREIMLQWGIAEANLFPPPAIELSDYFEHWDEISKDL